MTTKLLRGNVTIWAAYPEAFEDPANPKASEINNTDMVFNISCAIEDGYTLNMVGSDSDDSMTICDIGEVQTPTFYNYEASLDGFRDEDEIANGVYNLFFNLFKTLDVPFILIKRIGQPNDEEASAGEVVSLYEVVTDNPEDLVGDNEMIRLGARFKPTGNVNINVDLAA